MVIERELTTCAHCGRFPVLEAQVMDDDHKYPRPHWHARIECDCGITLGWWVISEQLSDYASTDYSKNQSSILEPRLQELIDAWNRRA
jgi:hypothetical protein